MEGWWLGVETDGRGADRVKMNFTDGSDRVSDREGEESGTSPRVFVLNSWV